MNVRVYIEKKENYDVISGSLAQSVGHICKLSNFKLYIIYDIFNIHEDNLSVLIENVLSDSLTDIVHYTKPQGRFAIAWEYLPGQYDQRGEAAEQCFSILGYKDEPTIKSGYMLLLSEPYFIDEIKKYLINPVESREKNLDFLGIESVTKTDGVFEINDFTSLSKFELLDFIKNYKLSINIDDIILIQQYFTKENRQPTIAEIKILDTYWSDHCRHTTFLTHINKIKIESDFKDIIQKSLYNYLFIKKETQQTSQPITLMDMATIVAKYFKKNKKLENVEESEEINACSVKVELKTEQGHEDWLLMFKNETHNYPTEIEPYGGASTCIGGAIRDPLSGRAYVYQAMRLSGSANPNESISDTIKNKLPQKKITTEAAKGFSSYGNQIGVTTTSVNEIYHNGYKAKRLEAGFVVGAVAQKHVRREKPKVGDVVMLIGGKTGKDGIGGASGSSKVVSSGLSTSEFCSEVQKGNATLERKLQRLFRNPNFLKLVKKSNDFGAGGVSVAIGELSRGVLIDLNKIPLKYEGLNPLEIAVSESQERMAIVCESSDIELITRLAYEENLDATEVAKVIEADALKMLWEGKEIVNIKRKFLDTNGASRSIDVIYADGNGKNPFIIDIAFTKDSFLKKIGSLKHCSQSGLINQFDFSIGKSSVLSPLGGMYQKTKEDVGVQTLPYYGQTKTCSAISYGYMPDIASWSTFHAGIYAVVESVTKLIASGVGLTDIYLSFQEYFERLENDGKKWGKPFGSLLGTIEAQINLNIAAIGGKDSMSGSYDCLAVPPTLISFAIGTLDINKVIPSTIPKGELFVYILKHPIDYYTLIPNWQLLHSVYDTFIKLNNENKILAAKAVNILSIDLVKMCLGNRIGLTINYEDIFKPLLGSIVFLSKEKIDLENVILIGETINEDVFYLNGVRITIDEVETNLEKTLQPIFPNQYPANEFIYNGDINIASYNPKNISVKKSHSKNAYPRVCMPIFMGTNCEYDTAYSFEKEGSIVKSFVFKSKNKDQIKESIKELALIIQNSQILCFPGGFSYSDEPDGCAKYIASIIKQPFIYDSIQNLLTKGGLIIGICNGFQGLVKSGLLPFNNNEYCCTLSHNLIGRHIASIARVKIISCLSPWIDCGEVGEIYQIPVSHGEGRFTADSKVVEQMIHKGQIVSQYVDITGNASMEFPYNPNGSDFAIEAITDPTGRIYGRMGHPERYNEGLFKNIPDMKYHNIFKNGIKYFQ